MGIIEGGVVIEGSRQNVLGDVIGASALGVAAVLPAVWDNGAQQVITTGIIGLDRPRRITATVAASTAAHVKAISVIVAGLDPLGLALTETLPAFTDNTPGTVTGVKVFALVNSVTIPAHDGATANTSLGAAGLPAVASTTGIHAAVTDNGAPQTITTAINQPDVPRNITATAGGTAGDIKAISVVITGTNAEGTVITETLPVFTVDTPGTVAGLKAFKTVTSILIPAHDGNGATTAIGFGDVVGIGHRLAGNTVIAAYLNRVLEGTAPTIVTSTTVLESNTADLNSALASVPVILELVQT